MIKPRLFLCGVAPEASQFFMKGSDDCHIIELSTHGDKANVNVQLEDVVKAFPSRIGPRTVDLLEIAAYVYTADCSTPRGTEWLHEESSEPWSRDFRLCIPVRDHDFWSRPDVNDTLRKILDFLSNDKYSFEFIRSPHSEAQQSYFAFSDLEDWPFSAVPRVVMFSGGLDSLAGALETATRGENTVLVSHRPVSTLDARQRALFAEIERKFPGRVLHVPVWVNKAKALGREHTQRTRSFLFAALGAIVAESVKAGGVRFFENGVVSLNLPVADEVVRARASRTTHPLVLHWLSEFLRKVVERPFVIDNPYLYLSKTDVMRLIAQCGGAGLISKTCSCAHTGFFQSSSQWHCGTCSQCIDRRIAVIAANLEEFDPGTDYVSDVFSGPRKPGYERNMAVDYVRHGLELHRMSEREITTRFNFEISRAVRGLSDRRDGADQIIKLHKRHGEAVCAVVQRQLKLHAHTLVAGALDPTSMLALVAGQQHLESSWVRYCDRLLEILKVGVPTACKSRKPENEMHLQEICDGILRPYDPDLVREYPFMRWSSVLTKPDWSLEQLRLFFEVKYVRKRQDLVPITEAIASDITKYGDNEQRVLYLVYDPEHIIPDDNKFAEPIMRRPGMRIGIVR